MSNKDYQPVRNSQDSQHDDDIEMDRFGGGSRQIPRPPRAAGQDEEDKRLMYDVDEEGGRDSEEGDRRRMSDDMDKATLEKFGGGTRRRSVSARRQPATARSCDFRVSKHLAGTKELTCWIVIIMAILQMVTDILCTAPSFHPSRRRRIQGFWQELRGHTICARSADMERTRRNGGCR